MTETAYLFSAAGAISLVTLIIMEIVLGIDNIIFISILADKLPKNLQKKARRIGLFMALIIRIMLLFSLSWLIGLKENLPLPFGLEFSGKDLILLAGGLFLLAKSTSEIHAKVRGEEDHKNPDLKKITLNNAIIQIIGLDIVFSFDSILTAVGLVNHILIMVLAVIISMLIMLAAAGPVSDFVNKHPTIKMLALSFLMMIGFMLVLEGFHQEVEKGYIYFAMAFSLIVELLNIRSSKKRKAH